MGAQGARTGGPGIGVSLTVVAERQGSEGLAVRRAVQQSLAEVPARTPVLVACSGGADSLALAAAAGFVASRQRRRAGGVTVDHGLQPGSPERARLVATTLVGMGLDPVEVVYVDPRTPRGTQRFGPEGTARTARYAALDAVAERHNAVVLLGHTLDDQAETVLLGLARGSGARSLAGMRPVTGRYLRPLLRLGRATVRAAVPAGLKAWDDPHNLDPVYARSRARHEVLPAMETGLGPGVAEALARTAELLRADADALDDWAARSYERCRAPESTSSPTRPAPDPPGLRVETLLTLPTAVRTRVLRRAALEAGSPATDLTAAHVDAVDALLTDWHGQRGIDLPGRVQAVRTGDELSFGRRT